MSKQMKPYHVVMSGPEAGRIEAIAGQGTRPANGAWVRKADFMDVYLNLGVLIEPPRYIARRLNVFQKLVNRLYQQTGSQMLLRWWTPSRQPNPDYSEFSFKLPNWEEHDMVQLLTKQSSLLPVGHPAR